MVKAVDLYLEKMARGEEIPPVELVTDERKEAFIRTQQHKLAKRARARRPAEEKPAEKPAEKGAAKPAAKPAAKSAPKSAAKPAAAKSAAAKSPAVPKPPKAE